MNSEKWQQIKAIFNEAAELRPAECEAFLKKQHGTSDEILDEVRKLLAAEEKHYFEKPLVNVSHIWQETTEDFTQRKIGEYKILRELGRGGMGVVFEAVRERDDFSQTVALKLLQRGMDSKDMLRRFQHERRILASLEHPNIARLLDGGVTEDGLSFLAMEFVDGKPLDQFCEEKNLNINERLRLFLQICAAVSFAHSRLVVHRDLKPSNIFVTANGTVKLLDFGIAKIISPDENLSVQTVTALGMMTPAYASPEQIRGDVVSTSSDIYSLGLILYELLTGVSAYKFPSNRPDEIARVVCEVEPPRPSSAVSCQPSAANTKSYSGQRTADSGQTQNPKSKIQNLKSLAGDLDNIVLKALRKETSRRYASVEQFADDIKRHLEGLPVTARPDTFSYRLEKFVKRNRIYVMTASLILITLIGGIVATGWQAYRAEKQRRAAEARFKQVRELANNIVFRYYDEAEKLPNSTTLREMFVKDTLDYLDSLAKDENASAELRAELGKAFLRIGRVQGRPTSANLGDTKGAIESYRKGLEILEPIATNSVDAELQSELVTAYTDYAVILNQTGDSTRSSEAFKKMISVGEKFRLQSPENETLASRLAVGYMFRGDSLPLGFGEDENIAAYRKTISICEQLLKKNPDDLRFNTNLNGASERYGYALIELAESARADEDLQAEKERLQEAEKLFAQNIKTGEKLVRLYPTQVLPPPILAAAQIGYATVLTETGDYARGLNTLRKAETYYRNGLATDSANIGQKFAVATVEQKLGTIYFRTGDIKEGEKMFAHAFELFNSLIKQDAENFTYIKLLGEAKFDYADELLSRGSLEKARQVYKESFDEMLTEAEKKKDTKFAASLAGLYHEKLGNCALAEAEKNKTGFEKAIAEYKQVIDIWQQHGALNIQGNLQNEKLFVLERKINRLRNQAK